MKVSLRSMWPLIRIGGSVGWRAFVSVSVDVDIYVAILANKANITPLRMVAFSSRSR